VRYTVLMLSAAGLLAAALVPGPMVAAHELDSERPLTRGQELAKDLPATTVEALPKGMKFEMLAKNAEFVTGIASLVSG
jgi:hypothetical protein